MSSAREVRNLVQQAIDKGATTGEDVHQAIARMPIDVLERIAPDVPLAATVANVQKMTIGTVYDPIRLVNRKAGEIADELLAGKKASPPPPSRSS